MSVLGDALEALFGVLVSGLDVPRGKPAPDIFLEAARQLGDAGREDRLLVVHRDHHGQSRDGGRVLLLRLLL